jgi:hypothetical protein
MRTEQPLDYVGYQEADSASQIIQVESSRLVPLLVALSFLGVVCGALGLAYGIIASERAKAAETRSTVAIMRTEGFTRALIAEKIDPYPHMQGEPP